jgi:ABC-2 type transport system ATP-binding protein
MALRRARVRFREAVDVAALARIEGITLLSDSDGQTAHLQVEGEMDSLIKALAAFPVSDFETERPSLEEIFLAYYASDDTEVN